MQIDIEKWLAEGDPTNDGRSDEVVSLVKNIPAAFEDVYACLQSPKPRGHAADALEKIGRDRPDLFLPYIDQILLLIKEDTVPMVQWHSAMLRATSWSIPIITGNSLKHSLPLSPTG